MALLSQRTIDRVAREYNKKFGLYPVRISASGQIIPSRKKQISLHDTPALAKIRAYGLQESMHWGEAYVFNIAEDVISWIVPMVNDDSLHGGLLGGEIIAGTDPANRKNIADDLAKTGGIAGTDALKYAKSLPLWPLHRIKEAAVYLYETFYQISGWRSELLKENRIKAKQQQQIAAAMEKHKFGKPAMSNIDRERMLLYLIRSGDRNAARQVLNETLATMYLFSPDLALLRARAIEMMGYLTRAAVEDSSFLEPLIVRNYEWMDRIIKAPNFETLSHVLMRALDDFMDGISLHGFNLYNPTVRKTMDFISTHYSENITLAAVARAVNLSSFRISHVIKEQTGKTIMQHVMIIRINKARRILDQTDKSCGEIAHETGFCDQSYFIRHFKKITGTTPSRYRRTRRPPDAIT